MSAEGEPLSPRAARILYNVDDALAGDGEPPVDVAPFVSRALRHQGVGAARRAWLLLHALEWQPRVTLAGRRGFSWLPRECRRAILAGWERSRLPFRRRAVGWLRGLLEDARAQARAHSSGA